MAQILVCDDEPLFQALVRSALTQDGHQVTCVDSAEALFAETGRATYDAVVCDLIMPDCDGLEVIRRLKASTGAPRLLSISAGMGGELQTTLLNAARALGADAILAKPFTPAQLRAAVAPLCQPDCP